jgi:HPt (histidine-containing phosphotransfer) domain-containing protein
MVDYELNELRREFLGEAREKVDELDAAVADLQSADAIERLAYLAHQLKGSGGSYGYPCISDDATEIEKAAEALPTTNGTFATIELKIREHVGNLRREIERAVRELE